VKFKLLNIPVAAVLYLWVLFVFWEISHLLTMIFIAYAAACMYGARLMIEHAEARHAQDGSVEFSKTGAIAVFGEARKSFHYVFYCERDVTQVLLTRLASELRSKLGCSELKETAFKDIDPDLPQPEIRGLRVAAAPGSTRKTRFTFLCSASRTGDVQGLRWWVLVMGERDPNKVFWRYATAPLSVPFVVRAYLRREFEPLHGLTSVDTGFFNSIDTLSRTREIEFVAYETLVATLESFGVDTSDLKAQRANILNINVSEGGRASVGSLVQGAFNRISSTSAPAGQN
jgi:hypothetical protein